MTFKVIKCLSAGMRCFCIRKRSKTLDDFEDAIVSQNTTMTTIVDNNGHVNLAFQLDETQTSTNNECDGVTNGDLSANNVIIKMKKNSPISLKHLKRKQREADEMEMNVYGSNEKVKSFEELFEDRENEKLKIEERIAYLKSQTEIRLKKFYEKKSTSTTFPSSSSAFDATKSATNS